MKRHRCLSIILIAISSITAAYSQENPAQLKEAAALHNKYSFSKAIEIYRGILEQRPDSTLKTEADTLYNMDIASRLITSENGSNMLRFASSPESVAKQVFPAENFFLNIPGFGKQTWMLPPADSTADAKGNPFNAMNYSKENNTLVFSAPDESGSWNIMLSTKLNDTLWSASQMLNENVTTAGNEILPHLSPDGKTLYFSSNGHYGMGGYDLYMSQWNEELGDWDVAQNLGFPYSSTGNDYIYYNTPDGIFTVIASDRETSRNEMTLYALRYEALPLKKEISEEEAPAMARMEMTKEESGQSQPTREETAIKQDTEYAAYAEAVKEVRALQNQLKVSIAQLDKRREEYANTRDSLQRVKMEQQMLSLETDLLTLSQSTTSAVSKLQQIELDFLSKGIIITNEIPFEQEEGRDTKGADVPAFSFAQNSMGETPSFIFEKLEPKVDLNFKILPEAVIADLSSIPDGLVYHIQLMTTGRKATTKALKGMSPVFERALSGGRYTYSAGLFYSYAEALKNLNTVRKKGFPTALITAYNNGKSISTKSARELEAKNANIYRVTIAGYDTLPAEALAVIRETTTRDIAKAAINGVMKFVIGPFDSKAQAEELASALTASQVTSVEVEKVGNN